MSNNLLNISMITNETLMVLENECVLVSKINREYDDRFAVAGAKIGAAVNVRKPARFKGTLGPALSVEDFNETSIPVILNKQFHVDTQFTTADLALSLDMFSSRVIKPAVAAIANKLDYDAAVAAYQTIANQVGVPGSPPTGALTYLQAGALLSSEGVPNDGSRMICLDPWSQAATVDSLKGLFNPQAALGSQYQKGQMGKATLGFDWYMDQNIVSYTVGAQGGSPVFTTTGTSTALLTSGWADNGTLQTSGWTAAAAPRLNVGDVFTIAGVYAVNPQNRSAYASNKLRQFVVRAGTGVSLTNGTFAPTFDVDGVTVTGGTYSSSGAGALTLSIAPAIISAGQFQNVTAAPANNAAISVVGAAGTVSPQCLAFHRDFLALAMADLELPEGVHFAGRAASKQGGYSIRVVRQYTINNDALPCRLDVLYGLSPLYREFGVRISG
jgi:hypothetical protein